MAVEFRHFFFKFTVVLIPLFSSFLIHSSGKHYIVGGKDYKWSIPVTNDFYSNWSSSHNFTVGDTLLFDYDSELHNLFQVSVRDYESCIANQAYKVYEQGPANVSLTEDGVFYFICTVLNYCSLGQKITITVQPPADPSNSHSSAPSVQS